MCRALQVVCVASDASSLQELKRATVSQDWELTPGATDVEEALAQVEDRRAHVLVAWGTFDDLVNRARERRPGLRIVTVGKEPVEVAADVNVTSVEEVRDAVLGVWPPGGPVRS
jgi:hypothetical protein